MTKGNIGYGVPPVGRRFQKGISGNPRGRPPRLQSLKWLVLQELDVKVEVPENGRMARYTKRELLARDLVNRAIRGDRQARNMVAEIDGDRVEQGATSPPIIRLIMEGDRTDDE